MGLRGADVFLDVAFHFKGLVANGVTNDFLDLPLCLIQSSFDLVFVDAHAVLLVHIPTCGRRAATAALRADGHDVVAIGELAKNGIPDPQVFDLAQSLERVLLTHNVEDFHALHLGRPRHRGIIAVYRDADPRKNMNHRQIAAAIRRLETLRVTITGDFHLLNH